MYDYLAFFYKIINLICSSTVQKIEGLLKYLLKRYKNYSNQFIELFQLKDLLHFNGFFRLPQTIQCPFFTMSCDQGLRKLLVIWMP